MKRDKIKAISFALLAAIFYAINMPCSKMLLETVSSIMMAGFLYIGAGVGIGIIFLFTLPNTKKTELLSANDLPYTVGMVALDILAPILLMYGLRSTTSANASLLNNFEIVATTVIAFVLFKETVAKGMWAAIALITLSSAILSCEDLSGLQFSWASLLVLRPPSVGALKTTARGRFPAKALMRS